MRKTFASPIAGRFNAHETRVQSVLHKANQNAVFDERCALGRRAFVIDRERAPSFINCPVIDNCDAFGGNALAQKSRKCRCLFAIKVAFEPVTDGFVQHHSRPARTQHHRHLARRCIDRLQIEKRFSQCFIGNLLPACRVEPAGVVKTAAGARSRRLDTFAVFRGNRDIEAHKRTNIRSPPAVGANDLHSLPATADRYAYLMDVGIFVADISVDFL